MVNLELSLKSRRDEANREAAGRILDAEPVLVQIAPAIDVVPGMRRDMVLTCGAPLPWPEITGIQRRSVVHGAIYEGLADSVEDALAKLDAGAITVDTTQRHDCVGVGVGVYTASMPVYVVENRAAGNRACCTLSEGSAPRVFAFGAWGPDVVERLHFVRDVMAPLLADAVRRAGGIPLKPIMRRALAMGDELHSRNDAGTQLFAAELVPHLVDLAGQRAEDVHRTLQHFRNTPNMFLRLSVAAAKSAADAAHGVSGSSLVTGMVASVKDFAIRVSGLGDEWFRGPPPEYLGTLVWGSTRDDMAWSGESLVMEAVGLGGFAQAAAFTLPAWGTPEEMVERSRRMYDITVAVDPSFKIPYLGRGIPVGIDVFKVIETGIRPALNGAVIRKDATGVAGIGPMAMSLELAAEAAAAYDRRYGAARDR
jgi:hypothetical protein